MATTDYTSKFDKKIINHIKPYLPKDYAICDKMIQDGMYQRDRLVELALSRESKGLYKMDSRDNWDFDDYSDAKSTTVNYRESQGPNGSIIISGVKNKITLRCLVYDPKRDTIRYIVIWKWNKNINRIEFTANLIADSKYINGECGIELNSFTELAQYSFKNKKHA